MVNSVDPDQMLHSAASELGLHCLGLSVPIFRVITKAHFGICIFGNAGLVSIN